MEYAKVLKKNALEIDFELLQESIIALKAEAVLNLLNGIKERFDCEIDLYGSINKKSFGLNVDTAIKYYRGWQIYLGFKANVSKNLSLFIAVDFASEWEHLFCQLIFQNETLKGQLKELWIKPEDKFYQYYQAGELNFKSPAFQSKKFLEDAGKEEIRKFTDELLKKIQEDLGTEIRLSLKTP